MLDKDSENIVLPDSDLELLVDELIDNVIIN